MRAEVKKIKRRLPKKFASTSDKEEPGVKNLEKLFEKVSLRNISLEERRKDAEKPLYLVRYE